MTADRGDINSWVQTYSGAQLRTFDRTVTFTANVYVRVFLFDSTFGAALRLDGRQYTVNSGFTRRYERVNANNTLFNNYVDGGINSGQLMYAQDIVDTIEQNVRRAVDLMESTIGNFSVTVAPCHASCHSSCHTSRGRR